MQPPSTLPELVDQLGRTYSPFERLKILGRAWALLRGMTSEQRMIVATQLGLDHADEVVEAIAKRTGQKTSPALISMIEKAQVKGTPHLPELIADLRDPKRRGERLKQGALAVGDALAQEVVPESQWLPPGAALPVETRPPAAAPVRLAEAPRPAPAPPAPPARPAAPKPAQAQPPPQPASAPQPAPRPAPPPAPSAAAAPAPASAPPPAAQPKQEEAAPSPPPAPPPPAARPEPAASTSRDAVLAGRLSAAPALTARFRLLRRHLDEAKGVSTAGLRSVLEGFPDGWARRRALLELLRGGVPGSLGDALALVEALGSERDRVWCLGALADSRAIRESDREALLALAGSPLARRRLERRLGVP